MARRRTATVIAAVLLVLVTAPALALQCAPLHRFVWHGPRPVDHVLGPGPLALAHRGWSAVAPENTLAAFRLAAELGVGVELDVGLCATGEVIVMHDDTLDRTTDGFGAIESTRIEDIRMLDAGTWFDPAFLGEPVPTLDAALAELGGRVLVNIELKTTDQREQLARAVIAAIERAGPETRARVFVSSFDPFLLEQVRAIDPTLVRGQILASFDESELAWYEKRALQGLVLNHRAQPDLLIVEDEWLTEDWQRAMQARGYRVLVWTVNERERAAVLRDRGVDGIISDAPDIPAEVLGIL